MTKWNLADGFVTDTHLLGPLWMSIDSSCALSSTPQVIANGDISGQSWDNGQDKTVWYSQTVRYADQVLTEKLYSKKEKISLKKRPTLIK